MVLFTDINPLWMALIPALGFVTAAIGIGSQIASMIMGGKQRRATLENTRAQTTLARQQSKSAKERRGREGQLFTQTQSITSQLLPRLQALMTGDRDALTQQVAPQLQQLTGARAAAGERIEQSGPASGAQVQAQLELEKSNFSERARLLSAAPKEAQAGLTQLLQLLLGSSAQQGQGADNAASVAASTLDSISANQTRRKFLNLQTLTGITSAAAGFGKSLFKRGGDISGLAGGIPNLGLGSGKTPGSPSGGNGDQSILQMLKGLGGR